MRVAVPIFKGRVSAVFDWAQQLIVVDHDGRTEKARREESLAGLAPPLRTGRLARLGVEVLLCGGISVPIAAMIQSQGIRVLAGLAGDVDAVLAAFFTGRLSDQKFAMPGWDFMPRPLGPQRGRRHRRRWGANRRGGRGRGGAV